MLIEKNARKYFKVNFFERLRMFQKKLRMFCSYIWYCGMLIIKIFSILCLYSSFSIAFAYIFFKKKNTRLIFFLVIGGETLDECGLKFLLAVRLHTFLTTSLPAYRAQLLHQGDFAIHCMEIPGMKKRDLIGQKEGSKE